MKKKVTKSIALVIALMLTLTMFSACGGSTVGSEGKTGTATAAVTNAATEGGNADTPKDSQKYVINYMTQGYARVYPDAELVKLYNDTFNVTLNPLFVEPSKWDDLLNLKLASNEIPDVWPAISVDRLLRYQGQGLLAEVPVATIEKNAPDMVKVINRDAKDAWVISSYQGKNYGIPYINASLMYRDAIAWRTDWLANVGITKIPDTLQEWEDALLKFRNDDPDKNGKKDTYGCSLSILAPVTAAFGPMVSMWWDSAWTEENGQVNYNAIDPKMKDALALLNKWYKLGILDPEFVTGENKGGYWAVSTDFVNGRIGLSAMGSSYHWGKEVKGASGTVLLTSGTQQTEFLKKFPKSDYDFGNPPIGPDGKSRGMTVSGVIPGCSYVFSSKLASEPDKLSKILQMFNWSEIDHKNWLLNAYGVEGKDYTITNTDGYAIMKPDDRLKDIQKHDAEGFAQLFLENDVENSKLISPVSYEYNAKWGLDKYGIPSILNRLVIPSYPKYMTDLSKLMTEAYVYIITGKKPVSYFDEFVKQWKAAGGEQLLKEANDSLKNAK